MLLADESLSARLIEVLRSSGFDVYSIQENHASASDEEVINLSLQPLRIIISEDKDFGTLVYHHNIKIIGVILLRYQPPDFEIIKNKLLKFLHDYPTEGLYGKFVVITAKLTRIRQLY